MEMVENGTGTGMDEMEPMLKFSKRWLRVVNN